MEVDDDGLQDSTRETVCNVQMKNTQAIMSKISKLYQDKMLSDITLVVDGMEFPAHRLILCSSSDVLEVMLMNPSWTEAMQNRVVLTESSGCTGVFGDFLKYIYTGEVELDIRNVIALLQLGDKYNVKDLVGLCIKYMTRHIPAAAVESELVKWLQYTVNCGHEQLAQSCKNYMKWNLASVVQAKDFGFLEPDLMCSILRDDDIVVLDEYTLYSYIDDWVSRQKQKYWDDPEALNKTVEQVVPLIRFPMMTPRQLADLLLIPLTQTYKEFMMEQMSISMAFHSGSKEQLNELLANHPHRSKLFTPRLYCTDQWSMALAIDRVSRFHQFSSKTIVFSTPVSFVERLLDKQMEWVVDFYPLGVKFKKHFLIVWEGTRECPEHILKTVRLAVQCKSEDGPVRVHISVLISGLQDGVEHIRSVSRKAYKFSDREKIVNMDGLLPYDEFVEKCANCKKSDGFSYFGMSSFTGPAYPRMENMKKCNDDCNARHYSSVSDSEFLIGDLRDKIKIRIVITPMP